MRKRFHYNQRELVEALRQVGLCRGDLVFSHVGLLSLGIPEEVAEGKDPFDVVLEAMLEVIGEEGTFVTPAYTYSFCKGEVFDPDNTPSAVGPFSERFRTYENVIRSHDPIFSVCGLGPKAEALFRNLPHDCYGEDSVFDRMTKSGAKICNMWNKLSNSFFHHYEQMVGVPYRHIKYFTGVVRISDAKNSETWAYYVRDLFEETENDDYLLEKTCTKQGIIKIKKVGLARVSCVNAKELKYFVAKQMRENAFYLTKKGRFSCAV